MTDRKDNSEINREGKGCLFWVECYDNNGKYWEADSGDIDPAGVRLYYRIRPSYSVSKGGLFYEDCSDTFLRYDRHEGEAWVCFGDATDWFEIMKGTGGRLRKSDVQNQEKAPLEDEIRAVCEEMAEMLLRKNRSYGNAVAEPVKIFAKRVDTLAQIDVRIDDKLSRLMKGSEYPGDDTVHDLVGYLLLRLAVILKHDNEAQKRWNDTQEKQTTSETAGGHHPEMIFMALDK